MKKFVYFCNFFLLFIGKVCGDLSLNNSVNSGCIVEENCCTKEQKSCVFPFFHAELYNECTKDGDPDQRYWCSTKVSTEGPCLTRLFGLGKSRISQIFSPCIFLAIYFIARFALCIFWAIYLISANFGLFFAKEIALKVS